MSGAASTRRAPIARIDVVAVTAPAHWASYLINGDASGLETAEVLACDRWLASIGLGAPVSCADAGFCWHHGAQNVAPYGAFCATYLFHAHGKSAHDTERTTAP